MIRDPSCLNQDLVNDTDEARQGRQTADLLKILGDLDGSTVMPALEEFARSPDTTVASAARDSLAALRRKDKTQ